MFGQQAAQLALKISEKNSADLAQHAALCTEFHRQAGDQRGAMAASISDVRKDLTGINANLQAQIRGLRNTFLSILLGVGGAAFLLIIGALGTLTMFLLEHIDRLAR